MLDVPQFRRLVLEPTLRRLAQVEPRLDVKAAHELLIGTAVKESLLTYLRQLPDGPALGLYQMEPATHTDMRRWMMRPGREAWREAIDGYVGAGERPIDALVGDLRYATAMVRLRYWVRPAPLPAADDIMGLAHYWDRWYQTVVDEHEPKVWARLYRQHCLASA